jgi:hypothetical protein
MILITSNSDPPEKLNERKDHPQAIDRHCGE